MPWYSRLGRKIFQPFSVKNANKIVAVSHATESEIKHYYEKEPNLVINPQVDKRYAICDKQEILRILDKYELKSYLLVLGTLEPRKNLVALLQAYLSVIGQGYNLPMLVLAGGKGWLEGELPELVAKGEQLGVVKKLGFVVADDMQALYAGAEVFILPSLYEGFGMPVLEAQLCGCPVLISDIPSLNEASGGIACKFEPTIKGIAGTLIKLSKNQLPLVCRLPCTSQNDSVQAARKMLSLIDDLDRVAK
ncbi:D-inositol 3-phosphate glycosyltransferase [invertebrate metagenome]|uniref:D-inositol 3-phosphate glycosyltransferase n=1 Tax=invertebrate metagenome TaxID=1711999 RepID=A0A2H9T4Q2_9ZZZZ